MYSSLYLRGGEVEEEEGGRGINGTGFVDMEELEQPAVFHPYPPNHHAVVVDSIPSSMYNNNNNNNLMKLSNVSTAVSNNLLQFGCLNTNICHQEMGSFLMQKGSLMAAIDTGGRGGGEGGSLLGSGNFDSWGDSTTATAITAMADNNNSQQTDTSTDVDTDDKNHHHHPQSNRGQMDSDQQIRRTGDQKTLRRLAQNREAARKSRLRKKAYVQQLEHSRIKLDQLEHEVQRTRHQTQGLFVSSSGLSMDQGGSSSIVANGGGGGGGGAIAFNAEYARWLGEHHLIINELRSALSSHAGESELRLLVDGVISHYDELFKLKGSASKADVFHVLSGMWKTPAERCFMWLGGFRSSELLKILGNQLEPLTDQQLVGICNLQQSSQQAEDALSQGVEALQQSLLETLLPSLGPCGGSGNVADYMGQMAIAMSKLSTLENFIHQADILRQQTLHQLHRILTTRQAGHALLVINDYMARLRALSSLWLARPRN